MARDQKRISGIIRLSISWMIPLGQVVSFFTSLAPLIDTPEESLNTEISEPCKVCSFPLFKSDAVILLEMTWYVRMETNASLFSGNKSVSRARGGSFSKASLVGAKNVKAPGPERAIARSAALIALVKDVRFGFLLIQSMIVLGIL